MMLKQVLVSMERCHTKADITKAINRSKEAPSQARLVRNPASLDMPSFAGTVSISPSAMVDVRDFYTAQHAQTLAQYTQKN